MDCASSPTTMMLPCCAASRSMNSRLDVVRILVLVDQHELELLLVDGGDLVVVLQQPQRLFEQVVEVHRVRRASSWPRSACGRCGVARPDRESTGTSHRRSAHVAAGVDGHAEDVRDDFRLRETLFLRVDPGGGDDRFHQVLLVLAVHDGKPAPEPEHLRVAAQDSVADGMERAAPEAVGAVGQESRDALQHLARGFVGEGEQEDVGGSTPFSSR